MMNNNQQNGAVMILCAKNCHLIAVVSHSHTHTYTYEEKIESEGEIESSTAFSLDTNLIDINCPFVHVEIK